MDWPHSEVSRINSALCGSLVVVHALTAMKIPSMRFLNTSVGAGAHRRCVPPHVSGNTVWNNVIAGLVVLLVSVGWLHRPLARGPMR